MCGLGSDNVYIVEMNLDGDITSGGSFHIAEESRTIGQNIRHMVFSEKTNRWVYAGRFETLEDAGNYAHDLRMAICQKMNLIPSA